jgi:hypothetical protein
MGLKRLLEEKAKEAQKKSEEKRNADRKKRLEWVLYF